MLMVIPSSALPLHLKSNKSPCIPLTLPLQATPMDPEAVLSSSRRCRGTRGGWCGPYTLQAPGGPFRAPPRGDKDCPEGCNGVGNCNYDTGLCECPAGEQMVAMHAPRGITSIHRAPCKPPCIAGGGALMVFRRRPVAGAAMRPWGLT